MQPGMRRAVFPVRGDEPGYWRRGTILQDTRRRATVHPLLVLMRNPVRKRHRGTRKSRDERKQGRDEADGRQGTHRPGS